jgi:hypothetical protein
MEKHMHAHDVKITGQNNADLHPLQICSSQNKVSTKYSTFQVLRYLW